MVHSQGPLGYVVMMGAHVGMTATGILPIASSSLGPREASRIDRRRL